MEAEAAGGCPQPRCSCENGDLIRAPFKHTGATSFEMGQYYLLVSLDRHQKMGVFASFLVGGRINFPNPFFSGCKLAEQYYNLGRKPFLALSLLAYPSVEQLPSPWGSWASDRIVIIGMPCWNNVVCTVLTVRAHVTVCGSKELHVGCEVHPARPG